jgi:hypothetical protein
MVWSRVTTAAPAYLISLVRKLEPSMNSPSSGSSQGTSVRSRQRLWMFSRVSRQSWMGFSELSSGRRVAGLRAAVFKNFTPV